MPLSFEGLFEERFTQTEEQKQTDTRWHCGGHAKTACVDDRSPLDLRFHD
jgi:hypothetical protein